MIGEIILEDGYENKFYELDEREKERYADILYEIESEKTKYIITVELLSPTYNNDSVITKFTQHGEYKKFVGLYII